MRDRVLLCECFCLPLLFSGVSTGASWIVRQRRRPNVDTGVKGQVGMVQGCVRTADVICKDDCDLLELKKDTILTIIDSAPKLYAALRVSTSAAQDISEAQDQPSPPSRARERESECGRAGAAGLCVAAGVSIVIGCP